MSAPSGGGPSTVGFPRFFKIAGYWVNSYKFFLCVGIYAGTLATAALANSSGLLSITPRPRGDDMCFGGIDRSACVSPARARSQLPLPSLRDCTVDTKHGGASGFGALLTFVPAFFAAAAWLDVPHPFG